MKSRRAKTISEVEIKRIIATRKSDLDYFARQLAMNFETPAKHIVAMACDRLGISQDDWYAIKSYQIEQEVTN